MAVPLTIGKFRAPAMPNFYDPGVGGGGFQPQKATPPGQPGPQYGGAYMHPSIPSGWTSSQQGGIQGQVAPPITFPQGVAGTPAYTPDYSSMIGGSWEVDAAESAMAAQMADARAAFQKNLRSNFVDLGYEGDTSKLGDFSKYIDKATLQKAIDNKFSAYAQIRDQQNKTNEVDAAMLASSGLGTSGTATETQKNTLSQVEQARYEGLRNFLSGGEQGLSGLSALKNQLAQGVLAARFAAAQRLASMYPATPAVQATEPDWNDFWGSYQGGNWAIPGGGYIVPSGIPNAQGGPTPWYVGSSSGTGGNLSWLNPHV